MGSEYHAHKQLLHISVQCSLDAKHHCMGELTYRVSAIGKLTIAAQAFLWNKAAMSGKDVVE